jgi:hypothetical protein
LLFSFSLFLFHCTTGAAQNQTSNQKSLNPMSTKKEMPVPYLFVAVLVFLYRLHPRSQQGSTSPGTAMQTANPG